MMLVVPLYDEFGDWATPKDSSAGHFFAPMDRDEFPELDAVTAAATPWPLFARWYADAVAAQLSEPAAMTLATVAADGAPSARVVLLRGFDERGITFYTNYQSRKADELAANARAALALYWDSLKRQIRIEGTTTRVSAA